MKKYNEQNGANKFDPKIIDSWKDTLYQNWADFFGGVVVKNSPANGGDAKDEDLIPGSERSLGEGNGNTL